MPSLAFLIAKKVSRSDSAKLLFAAVLLMARFSPKARADVTSACSLANFPAAMRSEPITSSVLTPSFSHLPSMAMLSSSPKPI